jgi:hypothetical protein
MLGLAVFVTVAAFCLRPASSDALRLPGTNFALPPLCASRAIFGLQCPGCGLTRSFVALAHGDVAESLRFNRVGWLLALAVVVQIPYRAYALAELRRRVVTRPWLAWFGYALIAALILNWFAKIVGI